MMIVLHTTRYGDSSLIVHGYTREEGRTSLMLRGAFRTSGKRRPSHPGAVLLHPLSIVNYVASKSPKAGMAYLREFSPKYRLHSIREDFDKISIAMFISELLYRTLLHSERDEDLYDFLFHRGRGAAVRGSGEQPSEFPPVVPGPVRRLFRISLRERF